MNTVGGSRNDRGRPPPGGRWRLLGEWAATIAFIGGLALAAGLFAL